MPAIVRDHQDAATALDLATGLGAGPWLVIAPHDDDAVIGAGATIAAAVRAGIEVHIAIVSDGGMGWDDPADAKRLIAIRRAEAERSTLAVGVPIARLHRLEFPDGSLHLHRGCKKDAEGTGIGRALTRLMRTIRPGAVFVCTDRDIHPDHQVTSGETAMAVAWASGIIWRELGEPIPAPRLWHYAVYCDFPKAPERQVRVESQDFGAKLASCACYESQPFIDEMVAKMRADGPVEYFHDATLSPYRPAVYASAFPNEGPTRDDRALRDDARQVLEGLDAWKPWPDLEQALVAPGGIRLVGEGSSRLFVGGFARHLLRTFGKAFPFDVCGGRAAPLAARTGTTLLVSNSGATREVIEHLTDAKPADPLALLGLDSGPLAKQVARRRIVLSRPETAVAATASVFLQAFTLGAAIARVSGQEVPTAALRASVAGLIEARLPDGLIDDLANADRLWWADAETGLADELALKTAELCGLLGVSVPGTMALHGCEEVFAANDRVLWMASDRRDDGLRAKVAASTGVPQIDLANLVPLPEVGPWRDLLQLVVGWRVLGALAVRLGRDPARPLRARKVGNPLEG